MQRHLGFLICAFAAVFAAAACSSAPKKTRGEMNEDVRVTVRQAQREFVLVNGTNEERVKRYSSVAEKANVKITNDEIMSTVLEALDELGFAELAVPGPAPQTLGPDVGFVLEVQRGNRAETVVELKGQPLDERQKIHTMVHNVIYVWNETYSLQTIEAKPGEDIFQEAAPRPN